MSARCILFVATLAVAHLSVAQTAEAQSPEGEPPLAVALELSFDELPPALQTELEPLTRAELDSLARTHGFSAAAVGGPADLMIHAKVSQPEGQSSVFLITASVEFEGETIREVKEDVCLRCTTSEVASEILVILPDALTQAREARAQAAAEAPPPTVDSEPVEAPILRDEPALLGPVGYVGIASSALGLGAAIAGGVFLHRGEVVVGEPLGPTIETVDHRPAGLALIGTGLGVMVLGNILLGVDLGILRKHRTEKTAQLVGFGATAGTCSGVVLHGRF
jgi:hypothetical protein